MWLVYSIEQIKYLREIWDKKQRTQEIFDIGYISAQDTFAESLFYQDTKSII